MEKGQNHMIVSLDPSDILKEHFLTFHGCFKDENIQTNIYFMKCFVTYML